MQTNDLENEDDDGEGEINQSINQSIKFLRRHSSVTVESEAVLDNESEAPKRKPAAVSCTPSRTSEFLVDDGIR